MRNITRHFFHCTASPQTQTVPQILAYWKNVMKWKTPGYHHLIEPDGAIHNLVPIETPSNGVAGFNANSIHTSYIGGVTTKETHSLNAPGTPVDNRTDAQKAAQKELLYKYAEMFPSAVILGHRDVSPDKNKNGIIEPNEWIKACPSFSVAGWLKEIGFKTPLQLKLYKTTAKVNLRSGAGRNFNIRRTIDKDTIVKMLGEADGWLYLEVFGTKDVGWISKEYLRLQ